MSHSSNRALELAAEQALGGICPEDWEELVLEMPDPNQRRASVEDFELTAALLAEAEAQPAVEALPESLMARLRDTTGLVRVQAEGVDPSKPPAPRETPVAVPGQEAEVPQAARSRRAHVDPWRWGGWAAAAVILLVWTLNPGPKPPAETAGKSPVSEDEPTLSDATPDSTGKPNPAEKPGSTEAPGPEEAPQPAPLARQELLRHEATLRSAWQATDDPAAAGVEGDVVWNTHEQEGYLRFRGLASNDPEKSQYQLWIFDEERNAAHPVDGGVFNVPAEGEVVIPIQAKLPVHEVALFAVTVERPGGVVVSDRERIVVTAKPESI